VIWHSSNHGRDTIDFDIKAVSLLCSKSHLTTTQLPADTKFATHATQQSLQFLDSYGWKTTRERPLATNSFKPLETSTGGLMSKDTADEVKSWKSILGETVFGRLGSAITDALSWSKLGH
jgi:hypothetical protein